ncbi:hypothetical protein IPZ59_14905 [Mongoliitalea daihaiensis]|nr:hypothetical protein IPZ59_14905 [Mongoliitalea daihaiensis]
MELFNQKKLSVEHVPAHYKLHIYSSEQETIAVVRYSIYQEFTPEGIFQAREFFNHVIVAVRAGLAGLVCYENQELVDHKVFRAYMVRKKQGKSQIKYLKTKGKSRAGSRVRLGETKEFFKQIAERLQDYEARMRVDHVFLSCATTLIPYLFEDNSFLKTAKIQKQISKIPFHIQQPTFENLLKAHHQLTFNQILIKENQFVNTQDINDFLSQSDEFRPSHDDW